MIVGDRVKSSLVDPAGIITMNHFTHQPEVRFYFIGGVTQSFHEIKIQDIGGVQTNAIDIKFADPEANDITDIIFHFWISLVQLDQKIIATPVFVRKPIIVFIIAIEVHITIPVTVTGMFPVFLDIFECKKISSGVIKYAIQNYSNALAVTFLYKS